MHTAYVPQHMLQGTRVFGWVTRVPSPGVFLSGVKGSYAVLLHVHAWLACRITLALLACSGSVALRTAALGCQASAVSPVTPSQLLMRPPACQVCRVLTLPATLLAARLQSLGVMHLLLASPMASLGPAPASACLLGASAAQSAPTQVRVL